MVWETPPWPSLLSKAERAELRVSNPLHPGAPEPVSRPLCHPRLACPPQCPASILIHVSHSRRAEGLGCGLTEEKYENQAERCDDAHDRKMREVGAHRQALSHQEHTGGVGTDKEPHLWGGSESVLVLMNCA